MFSFEAPHSERHEPRHYSGPDYLTCGGCAREFLLENIALFIAHKAWGCPHRARDSSSQPPADPGEDTSSPLTCSACSRVFMTARGLLLHVQQEHAVTICLRKGPLIISSGKTLSSSCSSPSHYNRGLVAPGPRSPFYCSAQDLSMKPSAFPAVSNSAADDSGVSANPDDDQVSRPGEPNQLALTQKDHQEKEGEGRQATQISAWDAHFADDKNENEPKDLSKKSSAVDVSEPHRFKSEEPHIAHSSAPHRDGQAPEFVGRSRSQSLRSDRSTSAAKKRRRCTGSDQEQDGAGGEGAPRGGRASVRRSTSSAGSRDTSRQSGLAGYKRGGGDRGRGREFPRDSGGRLEEGQYGYGDMIYQAGDAPICLVVGEDANSRTHDAAESDSGADRARNVQLKRLLMHDPPTRENPETSSLQAEVQAASPPNLMVMPKLEVDAATENHAGPGYYPEAQVPPFSAHARSISPSSSTSSSYKHHHRYLPAQFPRYLSEASMDVNIEQIIRATVTQEIEELNISNDSMERSPPPPARPPSSCYPRLVSGVSSSYQPIPLPMPPLVVSRGYFPPQPYGPGPSPPHLSPKQLRGARVSPGYDHPAAAAPGRQCGPENSLDMSSNAFDSGAGLYPVPHDSPAARMAMGYHHKAGMEELRREAGYRRGATSLYGGEADLQQWTPLARDVYSSPAITRVKSESPSEGDVMSPEDGDMKSLSNGRMKKRRYPTSRPFKCQHCDQAFNQRIHLKKHMSKHTGVKPFKCQQCDYSTVERSHLKVHYRIHTGEKPYRCMFCDYATAQNSTLKIHLKRHHEGQQQALSREAQTVGTPRSDGRRTPAGERMSAPRVLEDSAKVRKQSEAHAHYEAAYPSGQPEAKDRMSTGRGEQRAPLYPQHHAAGYKTPPRGQDAPPTTPSSISPINQEATFQREMGGARAWRTEMYGSSQQKSEESASRVSVSSSSSASCFSPSCSPGETVFPERKVSVTSEKENSSPFSTGWKDPHKGQRGDESVKKNGEKVPEIYGKCSSGGGGGDGGEKQHQFSSSLEERQRLVLEKDMRVDAVAAAGGDKPDSLVGGGNHMNDIDDDDDDDDIDFREEIREYNNGGVVKIDMPDKAFVRG